MPKKPFGLSLADQYSDCFGSKSTASRYTSSDKEQVITPDNFKHSTETEFHISLSPNSMSSDEEQNQSREDHPRGRRSPPDRAQDPNARSKSVSFARTADCEGVHNRHPAVETMASAPFRVGASSDKNKKCRRTMEDAHSFVYDFGGVLGQGYFAIFDGHAGKHAAEWCGENFHHTLLAEIKKAPDTPIPDVLNSTFQTADQELSKLAAQDGTHSGCTAVTAFLRVEDSNGKPAAVSDNAVSSDSTDQSGSKRKFGDGVHREKLKGLLGSFSSGSSASPRTSLDGAAPQVTPQRASSKRTLYTANVGDARAVLCRGGKAVRLTYDHKGSDAQEAKRITDAGGFVMNNRVNGVLAVTRSLGDSSMKEFVVGFPYTTETTLSEEDQFLILACDGLWDVCEDQEAVDIVSGLSKLDAQEASQALLEFALGRFSSDNLSVMVVAFH